MPTPDAAPMRSITLRIDDTTLAAIDTLTDPRGLLRNRTEVIRAAVEAYIAAAAKPAAPRAPRKAR